MCFDLSSSSFGKCTATMSKKAEKRGIKLTVLVVFFSFFTLILQENSSGFFFKLPRFHQLLAVYIITLRKVIWFFPQKRGNCCFASDLLNSLGSSVTAAAYSHRKAKENLSEEVLKTTLSDGTGLGC